MLGLLGCSGRTGDASPGTCVERAGDEDDCIGGMGGAGGTSGNGHSGSGGVSGAGGGFGTSGASGTAGVSAGASGVGFSGMGGVGGVAGDFAAGAGGFPAGTSELCTFNGTSFRVGDIFTSDCNQCLCTNSGVICTQVECDIAPCPTDSCLVGDACVPDGTQNVDAPDGCNLCTCDGGALYCTDEDCSEVCEATSCEVGGVCYADGALGIPAGDGCNTCSCAEGELSCTLAECERFDQPPCNEDACEQDGVCFPLNEATDDGCCVCEEGGLQCSDATWCDAGEPIGNRCDVDGDCEAGLECRGDLWGERPVCIRDCNFGCPTGTVCSDNVPGFGGGVLSNVCMRPCNVSADCEPFGSECDMPPGADRRYCF